MAGHIARDDETDVIERTLITVPRGKRWQGKSKLQ